MAQVARHFIGNAAEMSWALPLVGLYDGGEFVVNFVSRWGGAVFVDGRPHRLPVCPYTRGPLGVGRLSTRLYWSESGSAQADQSDLQDVACLLRTDGGRGSERAAPSIVQVASKGTALHGEAATQIDGDGDFVLEAHREVPDACEAEQTMVFEATEYVPSPACARAVRPLHRAPVPEDEQCIAELMADIDRLQKTACASAMTVEMSHGFGGGGFGSAMHTMAIQLQSAKKLGRALVYRGNYSYSACADEAVSCVWCDSPQCPLAEISGCHGSDLDGYNEVMRREGIHPSEGAWAPDEDFGLCFTGKNSLFRYVAALIGFLFRPQEALRQRARQLKHELGMPDQYLGVHIRHGDSCTALHAHSIEGQAAGRGYHDATNLPDDEGKNFEKRCTGLPSFAHALATLAEALGVTSVFVASDNPDATPLMRQLLPTLQFFENPSVDRAFMSDGVQGQLSSAAAELEQEIHKKVKQLSTARRRKILEEVTLDALILASSQGFVGQFRSHLSRFFFEVASHEQRRVVPYISVDGAAWCWGQKLHAPPHTPRGRMEELLHCW